MSYNSWWVQYGYSVTMWQCHVTNFHGEFGGRITLRSSEHWKDIGKSATNLLVTDIHSLFD